MARNLTNRTRTIGFLPHLSAILIISAVGIFQAPAHGAHQARLAPMPLRPDVDWFWLTIYSLLESMEEVLHGEAAAALDSLGATESSEVTHAQAISRAFYADGLRPGLTPDAISQGLADVREVRGKILANPDLCQDLYWDTFLVTLDEMEAALLNASAAAANRGAA